MIRLMPNHREAFRLRARKADGKVLKIIATGTVDAMRELFDTHNASSDYVELQIARVRGDKQVGHATRTPRYA